MRLGCLPWFIAIALLVGGGQSLYTGITNRKPVVVDIADIEPSQTNAKWLTVKGGELDVINFSYTSFLGSKPSEVYIPLVAPDEDSQVTPIKVLYQTKDAELLATVHELIKMDKDDSVTEDDMMVRLVEMGQEKLRPQRDISGLVQFGIDSGKDERKIRELYDNLAKENLIIEGGTKPSLIGGGLAFVAGLVVSGFLGMGLKSRPVQGPPALPTQPNS